jgi:hypothetical protein
VGVGVGKSTNELRTGMIRVLPHVSDPEAGLVATSGSPRVQWSGNNSPSSVPLSYPSLVRPSLFLVSLFSPSLGGISLRSIPPHTHAWRRRPTGQPPLAAVVTTHSSGARGDPHQRRRPSLSSKHGCGLQRSTRFGLQWSTDGGSDHRRWQGRRSSHQQRWGRGFGHHRTDLATGSCGGADPTTGNGDAWYRARWATRPNGLFLFHEIINQGGLLNSTASVNSVN